MKKWTIEQVEAARANNRRLMDCGPWMQEMIRECPSDETLRVDGLGEWECGWHGGDGDSIYRISENWPPTEQIEDAKPTPAEFSTQYMLGGEPYHPEDDEIELQRLVDGRDEMNDDIKVIHVRLRRFKLFVAKQEGVKG